MSTTQALCVGSRRVLSSAPHSGTLPTTGSSPGPAAGGVSCGLLRRRHGPPFSGAGPFLCVVNGPTGPGDTCNEAKCKIPGHSLRFRYDIQAPLYGPNPESGRDPSVHLEDPSEPPRAEGEEAAPLQQRDPLHAPLWCSGVNGFLPCGNDCRGDNPPRPSCRPTNGGVRNLTDAEGPVPPNIRAALGAFARAGAVAAWKEEEISLTWVTGETGARVRAAIADRWDEWVGRPHSIGTTFHATQLMTGHGCFPAYLYGIRRTDSPQCYHCGADRDDAEHTLIECPACTNARDSLVRELGGVHVTLPGIVRLSLDTPRAWAAFQSFSGLVMKAKEDAERERERMFLNRKRVYARSQRRVAPRRPLRARLQAALAAPGLV
ncbi:hypothetical protein M0804_015456 [Polistes exclamans]|nr:hypothetical protein M0804_015456 [Polistes exclamans]